MKFSNKYYNIRNTFLFLIISAISIYIYTRKPKPIVPIKQKSAVNEPSKPPESHLYLRRGKPVGILRVECKSCELIYTVNHKKRVMEITDGSIDRFIYPEKDELVNTHLKSFENQMIRVLAINPNGDVVSNVLDSFKRAEEKKNGYEMKYKVLKNTITIDILPKTDK